MEYVVGVQSIEDLNENNVDLFLKAIDRRSAQVWLFNKQLKEADKQGDKDKDSASRTQNTNKFMQNSMSNMSEINNLLFNEDPLRREELITGKMKDLREKIQSEIKKKIEKGKEPFPKEDS